MARQGGKVQMSTAGRIRCDSKSGGITNLMLSAYSKKHSGPVAAGFAVPSN